MKVDYQMDLVGQDKGDLTNLVIALDKDLRLTIKNEKMVRNLQHCNKIFSLCDSKRAEDDSMRHNL